jgi:hypothetical protein
MPLGEKVVRGLQWLALQPVGQWREHIKISQLEIGDYW